MLLPAVVVSLCGATTLSRRVRLGHWLATAGSAAALLATATLTCVGIGAAVTGGIAQPDPHSWTPSLSARETLIFTLPLAVITAANLWALAHLWRPRDRPTMR